MRYSERTRHRRARLAFESADGRGSERGGGTTITQRERRRPPMQSSSTLARSVRGRRQQQQKEITRHGPAGMYDEAVEREIERALYDPNVSAHYVPGRISPLGLRRSRGPTRANR